MLYLELSIIDERFKLFVNELCQMNVKYGVQYFEEKALNDTLYERLRKAGGMTVKFDNITTEISVLQLAYMGGDLVEEEIPYSYELHFLSCLMGTKLYNYSCQWLAFDFEKTFKKAVEVSITKRTSHWTIRTIISESQSSVPIQQVG